MSTRLRGDTIGRPRAPQREHHTGMNLASLMSRVTGSEGALRPEAGQVSLRAIERKLHAIHQDSIVGSE